MFPCTSCGICCQNIKYIQELKSYDNGDGVCIYYKDKQCTIYDKRPLECRIDEMFDKTFYKHFKNKKEYYIENAKVCNILQENSNIEDKYRIDIKNL